MARQKKLVVESEETQNITKEQKLKMMNLVSEQIKDEFGEGVLYEDEDSKRSLSNVPCLSTGLMAVDRVIGHYGGIPAGRTIEIFGNPTSGKTTLSLHLAAEVHKKEGAVVFFDLESKPCILLTELMLKELYL